MKYLRPLSLLTFSFVISPSMAASEFTPIVSFSVVADDNVYRLDSDVDEESLPSSISKADRVYKTTVGADLDWSYKRQNVKVFGLVEDNRFDENDQLDNLGQTLIADWSWRLGNNVFGLINANRSVRLSDFADTDSQDKSEKTDDSLGLTVNWKYHPSWKLGLSGTEYNSTYDTDARSVSDLKRRVAGIEWGYVPKSGSSLSLKYQTVDAEYPNRVVQDSSFIDKKHTQDSLLFNVDWRLTGKSRVDAEFGLVSRIHPTINQRDYDGVNLGVDYRLAYSSKLVFDIEAFKKIVSSNDLLASYYERTGLSLSSVWIYSDKVRLNASLSSEERDYSGQTGFVDGLSSSLIEKYSSSSLGVAYEPSRNFSLSFSYSFSDRKSSRQLRNFDSDILNLNLTVNL